MIDYALYYPYMIDGVNGQARKDFAIASNFELVVDGQTFYDITVVEGEITIDLKTVDKEIDIEK